MAHHALPAILPLGQLLCIHRTGRVAIEAVLERMLKMIEVEYLRAALI
jgi:hypothetical protein